MQKIFLTFFYSGLAPFAPGTCGTFLAVIFAVFILYFLGIETLFLLSILVFVASISVINDYEAKTKIHDDKSIVIDEVAGVWFALALGAWANNSLLNLVLVFLFFRFFDITKPSIIARVDKNVKGGLGVMLDDMLAGLFAGLLAAICHGVNLKYQLLNPFELSQIF